MLKENASYFPLQRNATAQGTDQTVDAVPVASASGCIWTYLAVSGGNRQLGKMEASWNLDGSTISYSRERIEDVGNCDGLSSMDVALSGSDIVFRSSSSNEWTIYYRRSRIG